MDHQFSQSQLGMGDGGFGGSQSTRSKLAVLSERIHGFEKQMESEAKQRRESEESRVIAIKEAITKLEKTLNAEIKRRVEANKALQAMFESQLLGVQDKLSSIFVEKFDQLQSALDALNDRLTVVERESAIEKEKQAKEWEEKNVVISKDMSTIKAALETESQLRQEREVQLAKRLGELEYRTEGKFEAEKNTRQQKYEQAHEEMEEAKRIRERNEEKFQTFVLEEIAALKNGLVLESQAREGADDDIVQAVNHYTTALQDALRLVTTA
ncbi:putative SF-assemblin [Toxoplasma gondii TgCatPRC2]|uniref:SF-assemblin, putative n=16 Tax=Toxoplasma gondii TaxID=5811 RepID=A0A125YP87_TOXGM|nr:SF-assemblin, putative [Toxoplasma gondii ME49]EPR63917.1 putative SF-assemblin [Toxoplasma gondii GT1]ESS28870.1 putative SF-assemblin [Toxoplasma gondii VEG]KAF4638255.1 putative SF-assemblin [Toxoplasma gondii]KFG38183.1 putative SF-assemblin [Toxoplasma gondii p89]KFG47594.1 putative SF-assemblin [Toxoplasma gondii GAB2-2007-GAL-DOM2]KFG50843.1 putative SF-assemblin [Toxoplasma gondii FOU]KFG64844.1 putative SF-assemblin [Toxoplasma gondii RUB]KFH05159.1 putative SF-assemblin [Toxopl|eukprot:XP_018634822.1 SF-assemblin, putative [Toxoplasma gondii ME49]